MYVRLPNNTSRGIPAWMFDEAVCASVRSADQPTIECGSLLRLCRLLDSYSGEMRNAAHDSTTTVPPGATASKRPSPTPSAIEPTVHVPTDAGRSPAKVRSTVGGNASIRRSKKQQSKKGIQ